MCRVCNWEEFLDEIDELTEDPRSDYAADTLNGIRETVEQNEHCTFGQRGAVLNIARAVERGRHRVDE